ncbi:MAG: hypothetical protein C4583_05775 [Anaerolineaceae bacterium]|nr:MAG: hypothetical protein C4583_05775 [Anaerolineaceae bacterium]
MRHLGSFNIFNFWFRIDDLWKKSKRPGNEPLKKSIIGFGFSFFVLIAAAVLPKLLQYKGLR